MNGCFVLTGFLVGDWWWVDGGSGGRAGGRGSGTNDTVKRYSRGGFVLVDPSVACPVAGRLISGRGAYCAPTENMS